MMTTKEKDARSAIKTILDQNGIPYRTNGENATNKLIDAIWKTFHVTLSEIRSPNRKKRVSYARRTFCHYMHTFYPCISKGVIGKMVTRSPQTICETLTAFITENDRRHNPEFRRYIEKIERRLDDMH